MVRSLLQTQTGLAARLVLLCPYLSNKLDDRFRRPNYFSGNQSHLLSFHFSTSLYAGLVFLHFPFPVKEASPSF